MNIVRLSTFLTSALLICLLTSCGDSTTAPPATTVVVYAVDPAYQALSETEAPWYGTLQRAEDNASGQGGPTYAVAYGQEAQRMHTEGVGAQLEGFVGKKVIVKGKLAASGGDFALWPALVKHYEIGLLDCTFEEVPTLEDKLSPYLEQLLAEPPGDQLERVAISFCDDVEVTPDSTQEELERLRASSYAMLAEALESYGVKIETTDWLIQGITAEMPLANVIGVAKRPDVGYINSLNEPPPPPP